MIHFFIVGRHETQIMDVSDKIKPLAESVLNELEIELVEIQFKGAPGNRLLRILVDTAEGVTIAQCTAASRAIAELLEMENIIPDRYRLEVSSPGVDRPLKTERDFRKNKGRRVRITYSLEEQKQTVTGVVEAVENGLVQLKDGNTVKEIAVELIEDARIVLQW